MDGNTLSDPCYVVQLAHDHELRVCSSYTASRREPQCLLDVEKIRILGPCRIIGIIILFLILSTHRLFPCMIRGFIQHFGISLASPSILLSESMEIVKGNLTIRNPTSSLNPSIYLPRSTYTKDPRPSLLLVLGGHFLREIAAVNYFLHHRHLFSDDASILVSSGALSRNELLNRTQVDPSLLQVHTRAVDTVTNFTTVIDQLSTTQLIAVATSRSHYRRAMWIASIVLGASGVHFIPIELPPSDEPPENLWRSARDIARCIIWVGTGIDGRHFVQWYKFSYSNK